MRNGCDKCIDTLEPEHLNRRVLIGKRPSRRVLMSKVNRLLQKMAVRLGPMPKGITEGASFRHQTRIIEKSQRRRLHLWSAELLWHPRTTHQQPHYKIDNDGRRNRQKQGANERR